MRTDANGKLRADIVAAWREGYSFREIMDLLSVSENTLSYNSTQLVKHGALVKVSKGKYISADMTQAKQHTPPPAVPVKQNGHLPPENASRRVQLPEYMRGRKPISLVIERNTDEIENVMRLELCIGGQWIAIPASGDLRMYIGERRVLYSPTQETYESVNAYRITTADGYQMDYAHDAQHPITIDRRGT